MAIHGDIISEALAEDYNSTNADSTAKLIHEQLQLLKRAYQRLGKWDDRGEESYYKMWDESVELFREDRPVWSKNDNIRKWTVKGAPAGHKDLGCWHPPSEWGFHQQVKRLSSNGSIHSSYRHSIHSHHDHHDYHDNHNHHTYIVA